MSYPARIAVLPHDSSELHIEEVTLPEPGPHQVVVRLYASGICHSQLHNIHAKRETNLVLGHEATGRVVAKGGEVRHVNEGDDVALTWVPRDVMASNRHAEDLRIDLGDSCADTVGGIFTWADTTITDEQFVIKLDAGDARNVACVLGCAVMTGAGAVVNTVTVTPDDSVAVFGAGGVGLCTIAAAKSAGAHKIIAVDLDNDKLKTAKKFGATHVVNAADEHAVKAVHGMTESDAGLTYIGKPVSGVDYAFDCIGLPVTMKQALSSCRRAVFGGRGGGTAVLVGLPSSPVEFNAMDIIVSEKKLVGSFCGSCTPDHDIPRFLKWHFDGRLDLNQLVTRRYRLEEINMAVTALDSGKISGRAILEFDSF